MAEQRAEQVRQECAKGIVYHKEAASKAGYVDRENRSYHRGYYDALTHILNLVEAPNA